MSRPDGRETIKKMSYNCPSGRALRRRYCGGFTLVELLVVIGIIAVLLGILIPTLGRAREQANRAACSSNLRTLAEAFIMYTNENKGWLPATGMGDGRLPHDWFYWDKTRNNGGSAIGPYLVSNLRRDALPSDPPAIKEEIFRCPSDDWTFRIRRSDPSDSSGPYKYSYVVNYWIGSGVEYLNQPSSVAPYTAAKLNQVKTPQDKAMLFEEDERTLDDGHGSPVFPGPTNLLSIRHDLKAKPSSLSPDTFNYSVLPNPTRRGNVAYCDGSVRYVMRKEFHISKAWKPRF